MSKTKSRVAAKFSEGTEIRVKAGVTLPDLSDIPLGNWAGTISEICVDQNPITYEIKWNQRTLDNMPSIYRKRCERDGYEWDTVWLNEDDLELDTGGDVPMEQPTKIVTRPLAMTDQGDRIRAIFHLTTDDPLPDVEYTTLSVYYHYLVDHLSFPFQARYRPDGGRRISTSDRVTVRSLYDVDDYDAEESYGLIGVGLCQDKRIEFPIRDIDVERNDPNRQLVKDYQSWMAGCD
jgi:hypothetical protein